MITLALIPLALRGVNYRALGAASVLRRNVLWLISGEVTRADFDALLDALRDSGTNHYRRLFDGKPGWRVVSDTNTVNGYTDVSPKIASQSTPIVRMKFFVSA